MIFKIKYFFSYTIPEYWDRFKYWVKHGNRWAVWSMFILIFSIPVIAVQTYYRYENLKQETVQKTTKKSSTLTNTYNNVLNEEVMTDGPEKYLQDQLGLKDKEDVIKKFDNNAKLKGQYNHVVNYAKQLNDINDFRNYLNPIVDELKCGESVKASTIHKDFKYSTMYDYPTENDYNNGILLIGINGNDKKEVELANDIYNHAKNYKIMVYDISDKSNDITFENIFYSFIQNRGSGKYKPGFDSSFKPKKAYGFCNGLMTINTDDLKKISDKMPTESIAKDE